MSWLSTTVVLPVAFAAFVGMQVSSTIGSASISGSVIDGNGAPVRRARVSLSGAGLRRDRSTVSDQRGRFTFFALPAGRFTVTADKPGFLKSSHGSRRPGRPGTPISVVDGQKLEKIDVTLPKAGVIAGTLVDRDGDVATAIDVRALRLVLDGGEHRLVLAGASRTDDRGSYRIPELVPGDYVLSATPAPGEDEAGSGEKAAFAPIYFPGTPVARAATPVRLGVSEERLGVDFVLPFVPTADVAGAIVVPKGHDTCEPLIALVPLTDGFVGAVAADIATVQSDGGRFVFSGVPPGSYRMEARCTIESAARNRPARVLWGSQVLSVDETAKSVSTIALDMRAGMRVSGLVSRAGSGRMGADDLASVRISLVPHGAEFAELGGRPLMAQLERDGRFAVDDVPPGRYEVEGMMSSARTKSTLGSRWTLESAMANGREALDFLLEVRPDEDLAGVQITFTQLQQQLSGSLTDSAGRPATDHTVIVFATDSRYWLPEGRRIGTARPATDGTFLIDHLPAGDYRIAVTADVASGEWFDPDFLKALVPGSIQVSLKPGAKVAQHLRLPAG